MVRFSKTDDLREIEINFGLAQRMWCPCDGSRLQTLVTLYGKGGKARMRIGTCDFCGYVGYIDYPPEKWVQEFYQSEWLRATETDIAKEVARRRRMSKKQIEADRAIRTVKLNKFLKRHPLSKSKQVFEIGCGYGQSLAYLAERGYKVIGCENSAFRAKCAQRAYGLAVSNVPFEDVRLQRKLAGSRLGLIFSHHVLEHVFDPGGVIRRVAKLQSIGDYIIVGVPDLYTEPSFMTLFYFAHPNAFTKQSLVNLLHRYAYEVVDDFSDQEEIYLVGRRVRLPIEIKRGEHYRVRSISKITNVFGLGKKYITPFRRLWCYRRLGFDQGGQVMHFELAERILGKWYRIFAHKLLMLYLLHRYGHLESYIACIVKDVPFRYSKYSQSPFEIQFEKSITLLTK